LAAVVVATKPSNLSLNFNFFHAAAYSVMHDLQYLNARKKMVYGIHALLHLFASQLKKRDKIKRKFSHRQIKIQSFDRQYLVRELFASKHM
jgi:hypothetical protein